MSGGRAIAAAELLRAGYTAKQVQQLLTLTDEGKIGEALDLAASFRREPAAGEDPA